MMYIINTMQSLVQVFRLYLEIFLGQGLYLKHLNAKVGKAGYPAFFYV